MSEDSSEFVFTDQMQWISNQVWKLTSIVGAAMCFTAVMVIGGVWLHPVARPYLDRVSFRLMTYALITNTIFGIANAVGASYTGPTWWCGFTIFILQFTLELSSFLLLCIALNLQLVIVHRVNGRKMEKYYICGSLIMSTILTVPPYAAKQYGWDVLSADCWYSNDNSKERLAWQIGTQLFWTMLTVIGECITAVVVISYMLKHRSIARPVSFPQNGSNTSKDRHISYANRYRNVILRIGTTGLYPAASAIVNLTSVATVMRASIHHGVHSMTGYRVILLSDFIYGGRAVIYALLAATDPSLVRAVKAIWRHALGLEVSSKSDTSKQTNPVMLSRLPDSGTVHIELTTLADGDKVDPLSPSSAKLRRDDEMYDSLPDYIVKGDPEAQDTSDPAREAQHRNVMEKGHQELLKRKGREDFQRQI